MTTRCHAAKRQDAPHYFVPEFHDAEALLERRPATELVPERRLMLTVLADALSTLRQACAMQGDLGARRLARELAWFESESAVWPFAFVPLCDALGLDAAYIRTRVRTMAHSGWWGAGGPAAPRSLWGHLGRRAATAARAPEGVASA